MDTRTCSIFVLMFFFFNDTATTEIYTLSLHDALPIFREEAMGAPNRCQATLVRNATEDARLRRTIRAETPGRQRDRKSTRLNSSHANISYAVFCLKKKKNSRFNYINYIRSIYQRITYT